MQPIRSGDLTASVGQTEQATGLGRTTIDKLMRDGTLVRKKVGRRTLITVESIERLVGAKVA
ncbi:MAG: excisionase [Pelagerythrobacter marensis]|nr:MAG: excisionase [Pelagerythrobacter marensis]